MSAITQDQILDFKLDLSSGERNNKELTKFDHVCDNTQTCLISHSNTLNELYYLKDELLKYSLPPNLLLQLTLLSSRTFRSFSDLNTLVRELIRLVQQYSVPWEEKGEVLKKLKADYESKQRQLLIAIKHLEMIAMEEERMKHERRLNHWMRLYTKTMAAKSIGRRWKFRIEPFKKKLSEGYNPYGSESESEEEEDEIFAKHRTSPSDTEDELRDLNSDRASELSQALSSRLGAATLRKVQFTGLEETDQLSSPDITPPPEHTRLVVPTSDVSTWTGEPEFDYHLILLLYRPKGLLKEKDIACSITLTDQLFTSQVYKPDDDEDYQFFHFSLSDETAAYLPTNIKDPQNTDLYFTPKVTIGVFPHSIADEMAAHCSLPLPEIILTGDSIEIVPPSTREEDIIETQEEEGEGDIESSVKLWQPDWEDVVTNVLIEDPEPVVYPLKLVEKIKDKEEDDDDKETSPSVSMVCQVVKIERHKMFHTGTSMQSLEILLQELGYRQPTEVESKAVSALMLEPTSPEEPLEVSEEEEDKMTAEQVAELTLKHAEELKQIQDQYEKRLQALTKTLSRVKSEKQKEIEQLEQALIESEASQHKRIKSPSELRQLLAQKRKVSKNTKGLPQWGKHLPDNFYERLELFAHDSIRKHAELTEKIKREVQLICEKQLATLHKLAPSVATNPDTAMNDVCLPALFMPTPTSRPVIYNPRAHSYFHPPGSTDNRVSQPPAIFKLPPVQPGYLSTLNLYELSQNFSQTGPAWLRTDTTSQSPRYTPAPPPSACDYYTQPTDKLEKSIIRRF